MAYYIKSHTHKKQVCDCKMNNFVYSDFFILYLALSKSPKQVLVNGDGLQCFSECLVWVGAVNVVHTL